MEQIRLENEQIEVTVNIHGAELRSLKSKADGQEYLWNADTKYWGRTSPVLFPFVGGVKNKVYRHEGKEYPMNQHGFARDMDFTLISRSTDEAWLALEDTDETRKVYPFHFHLEIGYRLEGTAVRVMWKVKNTNEKNMYFAIGAHPAFFCPVREGEKQSEYFLKFKDGEGNAPESLTNTVFGEGGVVTTQKKEYKLYKRRWVVLLSFVCVNAVMQYGWAFFSSIVTDAWHFYGFQDAASGEAAISALTMIIMGCMIVFSIPASWVFEKIGWYKTVSIAGIVLMVFTLLRGFIGGSSYTALVITTTGIAVTQPFIINAFGMISALWFPPAERGIANGWGMISTYLGVVMAQFGVPWLMSTFGLDIPGALKVFGFLSIPMILWFILFAREKPPTPPADEDLIERISFADGMKQLAKNKKFIYALLVFWLLQGVYFTLTTLMEPILQFFNGGSMDSLFIGTLGTILTVTGVITTLVLPIASDRSKSKKRKPIVLVCEIGTLVGLILIITGHTVGLQILMACCLGIFLTGVTPIVMVLGYESAYPVSEGTTESLMQLGANGWGLICLLAVNGIFQGNHMGTLVFFLAGTVLSLVLTMMIKEASLKERRIE